MPSSLIDINELSPCYEENDPQRFPGDGKQEQSDGWAEGDEGAAEKHRRRHFGSWWGNKATSSATLKRLVWFLDLIYRIVSVNLTNNRLQFSVLVKLLLPLYVHERITGSSHDVTPSHVTKKKNV